MYEVFIAYLLTDFITGTFHWYEDNYLDYSCKIPLLGIIARGNEMHHYYPRLMVNRPWWKNIMATLPVTVLLFLLLFFTLSERVWKRNRLFIISLLVFITFANFFHKISHLRDTETNDVVKWLQSVGLLQTHDYHKDHHEIPDRKFCAMTRYLNPALDSLHFWKRLEEVVFFLTGVKAQQKRPYEEYGPIHTDVHEKAKLPRPPPITEEELDELTTRLHQFYEV